MEMISYCIYTVTTCEKNFVIHAYVTMGLSHMSYVICHMTYVTMQCDITKTCKNIEFYRVLDTVIYWIIFGGKVSFNFTHLQ